MIPVLDVDELSITFKTRAGPVRVLEKVSFQVGKGETVGVVGESGSGKSVTAMAAMGILASTAEIAHGAIRYSDIDVTADRGRALADLRGRELSMIFQNPRAALNPIRRVGQQIADTLVRHGSTARADAPAAATAMLSKVRIPDPERRAQAYPFELSGGMCQRVMIALALACNPALLIADEPTTGLDVTTQAIVMDLIRDLGKARQMATILITHDLALASEYCDRLVVMHAGHVVESGPIADLLSNPRHPYTRRLLAAIPRPGAHLNDLQSIGGEMPDLRTAPASICRFAGRCDQRTEDCTNPLPRLVEGGRTVSCWNPA